ncbi:tRNA modification GTPase GTPBP3, mitochondrial [Caerostris darwini]|uniref:tRNA modification GTPase GTPBP3, mitochondrial n=1 Tax=Caerostris darwini TaxID=1538125 RepID=A0AAV4UFL9_9ARAC|nr:tRNA modification GTPase GTPBP3, mitochondrial [Caerostris darwini]
MSFTSVLLNLFQRCLKHHGKYQYGSNFNFKHLIAISNLTGFSTRYMGMHKYPERSTIYALSSPAVVVVRVSGSKASEVLLKLAKLKKLPEARKAVLCKLRDPETDELLDKALALWFPSPNSYTGEDLCELHLHGSKPVIKGVLNALQKLSHFRSAEPGEFTKRAFMAGKLDLTEVEGLADLLNAETEAQRRQALRQMDGILHKLYTDWTNRVKRCSARLEAYIDFGEDQHLDESILTSVQKEIEVLRCDISTHLQDQRKGERVRNGVFTVITGRPNVGKSTLMNYLCQKDVAIVSPTAGTTRDTLEFSMNLGGYMVNICDTAGIRQSFDAIEQEGMKRAKEKSSNADMLIFILEASRALALYQFSNVSEKDFISHLLRKELGEDYLKTVTNNSNEENIFENTLIMLNKLDLLSEEDLIKVSKIQEIHPSICAVSCLDGTGMSEFLNVFSEKIKNMCCGHVDLPTITQERHRMYVRNCLQDLIEYDECIEMDIAIAADKLRHSMNELGKITGKIRVEEILDVIFKEFCIGK